MKFRNVLQLGICMVLPLTVGTFTGIITAVSIPLWYVFLKKPVFTPPPGLFGPVWSTLYVLMGISLFLVWKSAPGRKRTTALIIFGIQMLLNFLWPFIFFQFRMLTLSAAEILLLWAGIIAMIVTFYRISKPAALLQIPYLCWVTFASVLNASIWCLNR